MKESKLDRINKIYKNLCDVFIEKEGTTIFTQTKDILKPLLYDLAKITFYASVVQSKEQVQNLHTITKLYEESLQDAHFMVTDQIKNDALTRLNKLIHDMALNIGLTILLPLSKQKVMIKSVT
ncbi:hypothetical protein [Candidatus Uabimicrobium amorphum]|uniref:Uncharacterized protein n=1 Tax=Uabimicrobium amorphum TaxID=2596890 RepID=A0A5S9INI9_UABAM|nr:hypothetical protein [Candidatus Uabimicrobium amorphum]BBM84592.1 hypothetical protein UABAM_02953 [Candidatus Uabimicrobium amorphum]